MADAGGIIGVASGVCRADCCASEPVLVSGCPLKGNGGLTAQEGRFCAHVRTTKKAERTVMMMVLILSIRFRGAECL